MSEAFTSAWPTNALLYGAASGNNLINTQRNALNMQKEEQEIGSANMEVVARAGLPLLNMSEEEAARAYGPLRQTLQSQGYGKNLPEQYPGHDVTRQFVALGIPAEKQWTRQQDIAAAKDMYTPPTTTGTAPAVPGGGGGGQPSMAIPARGTGGPGASASMPPEYLQHFREASAETGIPMDLLIAQARQESSFNPNARGGAGEIGLFQIKPSTAQQPGFGMTGVDPAMLTDPRANILFGARYLKARGGAGDPNNPAWQASALASYNGGGDPNYVANVNRYRPGMSPTDPAASVTAYTPGGAQPAAPGTTTTAAAPSARPVIAGDSIASPEGLGGTGVKGAGSKAVLTAVQADARAGKYSGQPVVLSTGASNDPTPDFGSIEQQIREAQAGNAGQITVLGVGPAIEAKAPGTNAKLAALAKSYGADFVPLPANQMSPDGVHPTLQGYATLKATPQVGGGAPGTPAPYQVATAGNAVPPPPGGAPGAAPAQAPTAAAPALPPPPSASRINGYTPEQHQVLGAMQRRGDPRLREQMNTFNDDNRAVDTRYETQVRQYQQDQRQAQQDAAASADRAERLRLSQAEAQRQEAAAAALAEQRRIENARAGVPTGQQRNPQTGVLEPIPGYRGATADERIDYSLKHDDPSSQDYADAWKARKWQIAPNGSVIEQDMSGYPPPTRSIQRPTFLPQPTGQALDEVRKADTDARVIVPAIDRYVDLHKGIGGSSWGAYFDNPRDPKAQQLIGAFNAMKTVLRSPTYANTGVLQPAEMEMLKQELVSPQTIRGLYATPQALEARLHEIKFAILSRQDAELRSVGKDGVIVRDKSDLAKIPGGGKFYDEDGNLRVKTRAE
jgi:soluble lytic murein transglycosylase-like protein